MRKDNKMADAEIIPTWLFTAIDVNGDVISGAKLECFAAGTSTPQAVFLDKALSSSAGVIITTDANGRWPNALFAQELQYKFILKDAADATLQTIDDWTPVTFRLATQFALQPFSTYNEGANTDAQDIYDLVIPDGFTLKLPQNASDSRAAAAIAATAQTTYTLFKNGGSIGTIVFAASGTTGTFTVASEVSFAAGDIFEIRGPSTADGSLADITVTVVFSRE